jgi:F0F1-type ATP synthase assembly protein I
VSAHCFRRRQAGFLVLKIFKIKGLIMTEPSADRPSARLPLKTVGCYTFAASRGGFRSQASLGTGRPGASVITLSWCRVLNSVAASRSAALRAAAYQLAAVALMALVLLASGWTASLAALLGGSSAVLGNALAANIALGGGVVTARSAFSRLMLGTGLKWLVVITIFAIASGVWRMAPLPLLAGLAVALIAYPLALNFCVRVERER